MTTLRRGARGGEVVQLQNALAAVGFDPGGADGAFGGNTDAAVRAFQAAHGLTADGVVGSETWATLLSTQAGPLAPEPLPGGPLAPATSASTAVVRAIAPPSRWPADYPTARPAPAGAGVLSLFRRPAINWSLIGVGIFVAWVLYRHNRGARRRGRRR